MERADLHTHTRASDGWHSAEELLLMARKAGLRAIAVTDHDTVGGLQEALDLGQRLGIEVVPGIEISTLYEGIDVHVLGYYVDFTDPWFLRRLEELRDTRDLRNRMIVERLRELGIEIDLQEVYAKQERGGNVGRPHIAAVLVDKGVVGSVEEAFEQYLGTGKKAYVVPPRISPLEALELIHQAGGACVLAHPGLYGKDDLIEQMIAKGMDGLEVYHPDHASDEEARYSRMAEEKGLIITGGSDFHGVRDGRAFHGPIGAKTVDMSAVHALREQAMAWRKKTQS
jgi:hypothetical protein